jgi:hypothetical protein
MWRFRSLETLARDLRYSLRTMVKNAGFTAAGVLMFMRATRRRPEFELSIRRKDRRLIIRE